MIWATSDLTPYWPKHIQMDWACPCKARSTGLKKEHPSAACWSWSWLPGVCAVPEKYRKVINKWKWDTNKKDSDGYNRRGRIKTNADDWVGTHGCLSGTAELGRNTCLPDDKHVNAPVWNIWSEQRSDVIWRDSWSHVPCDDVHPFKGWKQWKCCIRFKDHIV